VGSNDLLVSFKLNVLKPITTTGEQSSIDILSQWNKQTKTPFLSLFARGKRHYFRPPE